MLIRRYRDGSRSVNADFRPTPRRELRRAFVSVDGAPVVLQRLEFLLLRYLVGRRGQLVSREELRRDVWHGKGTLDSRTIDVHVCRLRRKLGVAGDQIQTIVSLGYRFVEANAANSPAIVRPARTAARPVNRGRRKCPSAEERGQQHRQAHAAGDDPDERDDRLTLTTSGSTS